MDAIRNPFPIWKSQVSLAIEEKNKQELIDSCYKQVNNEKVSKTKTASIIPMLRSDNYKRGPIPEILSLNKLECKTLIIARFGMLECGKNYKGTRSEQCITCKSDDTEEHRLNNCLKFSNINYSNCNEKLPFDTVFSTNVEKLRTIIQRIETVWNVKTGHGTMIT